MYKIPECYGLYIENNTCKNCKYKKECKKESKKTEEDYIKEKR